MTQVIRSPEQLGAALRRKRKQSRLSQGDLGGRVLLRQATISKLEDGSAGTKLGTLFDVLTALNLELVIRPRDKADPRSIEDIF
ncbi:MAG TPA: helix-turn-helix domain-containing protein [Parvibaculum sp.]|jgi:HTH-type transcriptional regulator/antitoxin HipB